MTNVTTKSMDAARFAALLDAYGADLSRWPEAERMIAHEYAKTNVEAVGMMAEARALDRLLAVSAVSFPVGLSERIMAHTKQPQRGSLTLGAIALAEPVRTGFNTLWPSMALWKPATVFASAIALGAVLGLQLSMPLTTSQTPAANESVLALATPSLAQDLD